MTQGPAMSASGAPPPMWMVSVICTTMGATNAHEWTRIKSFGGGGDFSKVTGAGRLVAQGCPDEGAEQRVRLERLGFELGMELAAQVPGMVPDFADFHVNSVGSLAGQAEAVLLEEIFIFAV